MPYQITIKPSDHSFACADDETVLAAAMRADLMIPYGCRNGACGNVQEPHPQRRDRLRRASGDHADRRREKRRDSRCCASGEPRTDLVLEVREVRRAGDIQHPQDAVPHREDRQGRARRRHRLAQAAGQRAPAIPRRAVHRFPAQGRSAAQLLAGNAAGGRRSCSSCTSGTCPADSSPISCSRNIKGREILRFEGPLGTFFLREESDKPIIFVAGGTGFAPIKAVIEHALNHGIDAVDGALLGRALARAISTCRSCPRNGSAAPRFHLHSGAVGPAARGRTGRAARASCTRR